MIGNANSTGIQLLAPTYASGTASGALVDVSAITGKFNVLLNSSALVGAGAIDVIVATCSASGATETTVATFTRHSSGTASGFQVAQVDSRDCSQYLIARINGSGATNGYAGVSALGYSAVS